MSGDPSFQAVVSHSAPLDPFTWTAAAGAGQLPVGFRTVQLKTFRDSLYVFGQRQISNITASETTFVVNSVTNNIGCIAPDSVVEISGDIQFLAPDGIRPISGTDKIGDINIATVSKPIQDFVNTIQDTYNLENLVSCVIRKKSQFRYFVSDTTPTGLNTGIIAGLRSSDNAAGWEFAEMMGIRAAVCESGYLGDDEVILHGDYEGNVFQQESGNDFDGQDVISIYATPYLTFGDSEIRKMLRSINTFFRVEGNLSLSLSVDLDWGRLEILDPVNYLITSGSGLVAVYDSGSTYDSGVVYGGGYNSPVVATNLEGSFFSVKFTFTGSNRDRPHSINGFVTEFTTQQRR